MRAPEVRGALADARLGPAVRRTTDRLAAGRVSALDAMGNSVEARARARAARQRAVSDLENSIHRFTAAATARGTFVHHAVDGAAAVATVTEILDQAQARRIVKSKSMATEEIGLRQALEATGREVVETDLGEWIVQLAGETPSHLIVPAVHLDRQRIRDLLSAKAGRDLGPETTALAGFAREHLRASFLAADAGISGANILVAETGSMVIVSNEGNARMCTTVPHLHIAVVGVEKVVTTWSEALDVLEVLPRSATGQAMTTYVSMLTGPRSSKDADGPEEMHIVLLDNGRSALVGTPAEELLYCIRCGACLNVCPVYRSTGGHAYGSVYAGPIGAALTPHLSHGTKGRELPWASSLCGACREVCPVGIALDDQLIALRGLYPKRGAEGRGEDIGIRVFTAVASRPRAFASSLRLARALLGKRRIARLPGPLAGWTRSRSMRPIAAGSATPHRPLRPLGPPSSATVPPAPPERVPTDPVLAFLARWEGNGGHAMVLGAGDVASMVRELVGEARCAADPGLEGLAPSPPVTPTEAEVGLVAPAAAAAQTCTLILTSGEGRHRRTSLLPRRIVFILPVERLHPDLHTAFGSLGQLAGNTPPGAVTLVSGPSRSADIENDQTIGVHGPGDVWALLVR